MSYKKVFPKTSLKKVDVLAADGAFCVGCFVSGGRLIPAINSATKLNALPGVPLAAWYVLSRDRYIIYTQDQHVYHAAGALNSPLSVTMSAKNPSLVEMHKSTGTQSTSYILGDNNYLTIDSLCLIYSFSGGVNSCVLKSGRIFGIDNSNPHKIKWSGEGGIDDWKEGISGSGWAHVQHGQGKILNLIVYKDKIVAVREHGLAFLSAYGTPENFKMSYYEGWTPEIIINTAAVVGSLLMFYTADGMYFYDGNKVEKCTFGLAEELKTPSATACLDGKYFLCGVSKTLERKVILVYNPILNTSYIIDVPANAVSVGKKIFAYSNTYEYQLEEGGEYTFTSGELDFSSRGVKVLKEVILDDAEDVTVEVSNGVISRIVGGVRGKFRPNMRGKSFKIKVYGTGKISGISAVAEVVDGV